MLVAVFVGVFRAMLRRPHKCPATRLTFPDLRLLRRREVGSSFRYWCCFVQKQRAVYEYLAPFRRAQHDNAREMRERTIVLLLMSMDIWSLMLIVLLLSVVARIC